jgi:hypothetical protein
MEPLMSFGMAIEVMRDGKRVARSGWNGKGMYLFVVTEWTLPAEIAAVHTHPDGSKLQRLPFIAMKTADDKIVPWLASQTDMLALDWNIV